MCETLFGIFHSLQRAREQGVQSKSSSACLCQPGEDSEKYDGGFLSERNAQGHKFHRGEAVTAVVHLVTACESLQDISPVQMVSS